MGPCFTTAPLGGCGEGSGVGGGARVPRGWDGGRGEGPPPAGEGVCELAVVSERASRPRRGGGEGVALSLWEEDRVTQSPGGVRGLLESRAGISGLPREG